MIKNKLFQLQSKRKSVWDQYLNTDFKSWKKKLLRLEIQIIDLQLKREKLRDQYF